MSVYSVILALELLLIDATVIVLVCKAGDFFLYLSRSLKSNCTDNRTVYSAQNTMACRDHSYFFFPKKMSSAMSQNDLTSRKPITIVSIPLSIEIPPQSLQPTYSLSRGTPAPPCSFQRDDFVVLLSISVTYIPSDYLFARKAAILFATLSLMLL